MIRINYGRNVNKKLMARRLRKRRRKKYKLNWQIKKLNNFRFLPENSKEMNESVGAGRSIAAKDDAEKEWKEKI